MSVTDDPALRIRRIQKQREQEHEQFQRAVSKMKEQVVVKSINEKFCSKFSTEDDILRQETIGLQTLSDFRKKRQRIEAGKLSEANEREIKRSRIVPQKVTNKLSFTLEDDEEEEEEVPSGKPLKLGKDPSIDTSFLPDKGRDEFLEQEKRRLQLEWLQKQEEIKDAPLKIDYCFYDGTSHRKTTSIKKGDSIKEFLNQAKRKFPEIQDAGTDTLLFVKENVMIPHHYTFYELIEAKAQGKSGPLDIWSLEGEAATTATRTSAHAYAAKIVERHFYERNKHIYPFNHWEVYTESLLLKKSKF